MSVRFMFVFDILFILFRIAWCPSDGKELTSRFAARAVLLYAVLRNCLCYFLALFPVWCLGKDVESECIDFAVRDFTGGILIDKT